MAAGKHEVLSPLKLNGKRHEIGRIVDLDAENAERLVANGTVKPAAEKKKVEKAGDDDGDKKKAGDNTPPGGGK